ncbi:hypothetical protein [Leptospira adleri]|uniref:Uncharacterized protein n=1 Tax=Leptospira adleri TaxID=2023186 RepID=A0A2M9YQN3_9LEPT|nr:hypothetical protein [Leptospira adleri]PJZ53835.1 hypothetical protein CH380_07435 [Leptospira adleri]PJZ63147.1 hypothetical protein CH376_04690 [Leptospira adleri]
MILKFIVVEPKKIGAILSVFIILYCSILLVPIIDSGKNASPISASSETSETKEGEKEKTSELMLEDFSSSDDSFVLGVPVEVVSYYDASDFILPQLYFKIENPPPEKLSLSSI